MSLYGDFYREGFYNGRFEKTEKLLSAINKSKSYTSNSQDFFWKSKYNNTEDFRPNLYTLDNEFVDILFKNNIPTLINKLTQKRLYLAHIQLRRVFPGQNSYMDWHRDTYFSEGNVSGTSPPGYKIIYFPKGDNFKEKQLSIIPKTHNIHNCFQNASEIIAPGLSKFDLQIINSQQNNFININNDDEEFYFFDTSILHAANNVTNPNGSYRLIYLFVTEDQYKERYSSKKDHSELYDYYRSELKK